MTTSAHGAKATGLPRRSKAAIESDQRVTAIRKRIGDAIGAVTLEHEDMSYSELIVALTEETAVWARYLRHDELADSA